MKTLVLISLFAVACSHSPRKPPPSPEFYVRAGIGVQPAAVRRADEIASQMLSHAPLIRERMRDEPYTIAILSQFYRVTDMPGYEFWRGLRTEDGRPYEEVRGFAGRSEAIVPEENLLCTVNQAHWNHNVMVHELAHSIEYFIDFPLYLELKEAYENARASELYPKDNYILSNYHEYFAMSSEAWFNSTKYTEANSGITTREKLMAHDPRVAAVMQKIFGEAQLERQAGCMY